MFNTARQLERFSDEIRLLTLKMLQHRGSGYYGGTLSIIETLAALYGEIMNIDPGNPDCQDRDYFILSKGHAGAALYSTLALIGYFSEEMLYTLDGNGSSLPFYPDRLLIPGVEMTIGSSGHGISIAAGIALSHKLSNSRNYTYCIVGDGELNDGECWEAIQFANCHNLKNLVLLVDVNNNAYQLKNRLGEKFEAFGFYTTYADGASAANIVLTIEKAESVAEKPIAILLDTVKGQGVPYIENLESNHFIKLSRQDHNALEDTIKELEERLERR